MVIAQFLNPNDIKIGEFDDSMIIHPIVQNISDTYIRISKYLRSDIKTSCLLINNALIQILNSIIEHEDITCITTATGIEKIISTLSFKKIIPEDVIFQIKQCLNLVISEENGKILNYNNKYAELIFKNIKHIIEWFYKEYLKNPDYFYDIYSKVHEEFYKEIADVKAFSLSELIKKGWSLEMFAQEMVKLFYKTIDNLATDNVSTVDEMIQIIKSHNETNWLLIDSKNNVIGCWTLDPLFDEYFYRIKRGVLCFRIYR